MGTPIDALLQKGITAARAGQQDQARAVLLRVIEIDDRSVQAWYWLSRVVESPQEKEICLENVLALDPAHTAVQAELAALRREIAKAGATAKCPDAAPGAALPDTPVEDIIAGAALEPLPCPYCGAESSATARRCPACHGKLFAREHRRVQHSIYSLGLVACWFALANYAWMATVVSYLFSSLSSAAATTPGTACTLNTVAHLLGIDARPLPAPELPLPLLLGGGTIIFAGSLLVAWGLYRRLRTFYWLTVTCIVAYPLFVLYLVLGAESIFLLPLVANGLVFLAAISFAFMAYDEFSWDERRLAAEIDRDVDSHSALFGRGRRYAASGMWAKAAAHWARAVAHSPGNADYRLALATAYLNLGQLDQANEHLEIARQIVPNHPQIDQVLVGLGHEPSQARSIP